MKKILITYATAGIGHKKAALAIFEAFGDRYKDIEVRLVDVLDYTNLLFRETYSVIYLFLINRLSFLWAFFYYVLNFKPAHFFLSPLRRALHALNGIRFIKFVRDYAPDVVISTHFLPPDLCYYSKGKCAESAHVMNVITDYRVHSFWISSGVDTYVVGHENVKQELAGKWGIPSGSIKVTGIPVEPKFSERHDKSLMRQRLGIAPDSFTVLLLSGGYGVGPIFKILEILNKAGFPLTAIAVCGHNKKLHARLEGFKKIAAINILNLGYVDNIDELMTASDTCIGKAGGISTSEALTKGVPFIFVKPIPGQESANANLFTKIGTAIELKKVRDILDIVSELRSSAVKMAGLKQNIERARKPHAARDIADFAVRVLKDK
jgi:processive 1,2-diacylglycerol beta-glucosyltransferase